jgi:hypothetical protein
MFSKLKIALLIGSGWALTAQVALANDTNRVPEPGTIALAGLGLVAALLITKRRK